MLSRCCMFPCHCTLLHPHVYFDLKHRKSCNLSSCLYNIHPCRRVLNILKFKIKPKNLCLLAPCRIADERLRVWQSLGTHRTTQMMISYSTNPAYRLSRALRRGGWFSSTHIRTHAPTPHSLIQRAADLPPQSPSAAPEGSCLVR